MVAFVIFGVFFPYPFLLAMAIGITVAAMFALFYPFYLVWMFLGVDNSKPEWYLKGGGSPYPEGTVGHQYIHGE